MQKQVAYKILSDDEFAHLRRDGRFEGSSNDVASGYIHLSNREQLHGTAKKHFKGRSDLVLLTVELASLGSSVRWEASRSGQIYPHVYGVLPLEAVSAIEKISVSVDGEVHSLGIIA